MILNSSVTVRAYGCLKTSFIRLERVIRRRGASPPACVQEHYDCKAANSAVQLTDAWNAALTFPASRFNC